MTTPTPERWTAATESNVTSRIGRFVAGQDGEFLVNRDLARMILADLADAGVLVAPGGETRQEWRVSVDGWASKPAPSREWCTETFPNGSLEIRHVHVGPWREVTDDPA